MEEYSPILYEELESAIENKSFCLLSFEDGSEYFAFILSHDDVCLRAYVYVPVARENMDEDDEPDLKHTKMVLQIAKLDTIMIDVEHLVSDYRGFEGFKINLLKQDKEKKESAARRKEKRKKVKEEKS